MVHVILTHEVQDYAQWREDFDAGEAFRVQNGVTVLDVYTAVDNSNKVTILTEFPSVEAVHGFMNAPSFKEAAQKAGVVGAPELKILQKM
jgi:quinol monooxygenase YgiN